MLKFFAVVSAVGDGDPDLLDAPALRAAFPGLVSCTVNLVEVPPADFEPRARPGDPPAAAVVALTFPDAAGLDPTAVAAALPWPGDVFLVREQPQWTSPRTWPLGTRTPGVKRISFVSPLPHLSVEEFAVHWRDVHGPLARTHHPGLWRYTQNVVRATSPGAPPTTGMAELGFPTAADYRDRRYDSDEGAEIIRADVTSFLDPSRSRGLWVGEYILIE